jgi:Lamin Tail Domain
MRRSLAALVAAGVAAVSLLTGATANAADSAVAAPQKSFTFVIDQFATRGPSGPQDQYIQIKNISLVPQDLSNFKITAAASFSQIFDLVTIPLGTVLQPGQVYVIANAQGFSGAVVDQYFTTTTPLVDQTGIAIVSPSNVRLDSVGTTASSPFTLGRPATPLTSNAPLALVRHSVTENNASDFSIAMRTPGVPGPVSLIAP